MIYGALRKKVLGAINQTLCVKIWKQIEYNKLSFLNLELAHTLNKDWPNPNSSGSCTKELWGKKHHKKVVLNHGQVYFLMPEN